jgi:hypothetical protein
MTPADAESGAGAGDGRGTGGRRDSGMLVDLDVPVERIRVERFGPTG